MSAMGGRGTYGTEHDPVNCSFFLRIGACRHGENCPKKHTWPAFSQVIMFEHLWIAPKKVLAKKRLRDEHYENFCEDLVEECMKYGEIEEVLTYSNMGDHMIGNTFVRFADEDQAAACLSSTQGRYYAGRKVTCKFSPVVDFDNARCRDYQSNDCKRGQFCNFAHFMPVPRFVTNLLSKSSVWRSVERRKQKQLRLKDRKDGWPPFPIGALRPERMECIAKWNRLRERNGQKPKTFDERPETQSSLKLFRPDGGDVIDE